MVTVTFKYEPEEPDGADPSGVSEAEYERVTDALIELGGQDIKIEKGGD